MGKPHWLGLQPRSSLPSSGPSSTYGLTVLPTHSNLQLHKHVLHHFYKTKYITNIPVWCYYSANILKTQLYNYLYIPI